MSLYVAKLKYNILFKTKNLFTKHKVQKTYIYQMLTVFDGLNFKDVSNFREYVNGNAGILNRCSLLQAQTWPVFQILQSEIANPVQSEFWLSPIILYAFYSRTSISRTSLGPWKFVLDMGNSIIVILWRQVRRQMRII